MDGEMRFRDDDDTTDTLRVKTVEAAVDNRRAAKARRLLHQGLNPVKIIQETRRAAIEFSQNVAS